MSSLSPELSAKLNPRESGGIPLLNLAGESRSDNTITNTAPTAALINNLHDFDALLGAPLSVTDGVEGNDFVGGGIGGNDINGVNHGARGTVAAAGTAAGGGGRGMSTLPPTPGDTMPLRMPSARGRGQGTDPDVARRPAIIGGASGGSTMSDIKLRRFMAHNQRLREQLDMPRIPVSEASRSLIQYVTSTRDPFLPSIWGSVGPDPFANPSKGCCSLL